MITKCLILFLLLCFIDWIKFVWCLGQHNVHFSGYLLSLKKNVGLMVHFAYRCVQMDNVNNLNTDFGHWQLSCQYCVPTVSDNSTESGGKGSKKCHYPENAYWITRYSLRNPDFLSIFTGRKIAFCVGMLFKVLYLFVERIR